MDFLDPEKTRREKIILTVGYICVAIAILMATIILLNLAYGYGLNKKGEVIQNGLLFVSSQPNPANIYVDGQRNRAQTNTRLLLPEGTYSVKLSRSGYRDWQRTINVEGGEVDHFDYPFLFPKELTTSVKQTFETAPAMSSQSLDKRWLLVQTPGTVATFQLFDLKTPTQAPTVYEVPATAFTAPTDPKAVQTWQAIEWASDNRHVLMKHMFGDAYEYILLDRTDGTKAVNLSTILAENPTKLQLHNKRYDRYLLYEAATKTLRTATLSDPAPKVYVDGVLEYKAYGDNGLLYVTPSRTDEKNVKFVYLDGTTPYTLRSTRASTKYFVDVAKYSGDMFAVTGSVGESKVTIYKNPLSQINDPEINVAVPVQVLRVPHPTYLDFSQNARFIVLEDGSNFAIYDNEDAKGFSYQTTEALDSPQAHATWMDGHRLQLVTQGKLVVFDYDNRNKQTLVPALPQYDPVYNAAYTVLYTFAPGVEDPAKPVLSSTSLLAPADR